MITTKITFDDGTISYISKPEGVKVTIDKSGASPVAEEVVQNMDKGEIEKAQQESSPKQL
jgi:hypothetical protein